MKDDIKDELKNELGSTIKRTKENTAYVRNESKESLGEVESMDETTAKDFTFQIQ